MANSSRHNTNRAHRSANNPSYGTGNKHSQKPQKRRQRRIKEEDIAPPAETPWRSSDFYASLQSPFANRRSGNKKQTQDGTKKKNFHGKPFKGKPRHK